MDGQRKVEDGGQRRHCRYERAGTAGELEQDEQLANTGRKIEQKIVDSRRYTRNLTVKFGGDVDQH
jgi:hypothetical protein